MPKTLKRKPSAAARCRWTDDFADGVRCDALATGDVVVLQESPGRHKWPEPMTGGHCERHGRKITERGPKVSPGVILEYRPYQESPKPRKRARKGSGAQE